MSAPWICRACRTGLARNIYKSNAPSRRYLSANSKYFRISEEVQQALAEKKPVVALESTIYTHGFPYPENLALASRLESLVRLNGGVPATIGILEGVARVGLAADELVRLVSAPASKISRRDFGFVLGLKNAEGKALNGGTTVSGTMVLAHKAGIRVFGTGGLGGVHRGADQTMDVSADLTELGRTPVAVVSSGCKSFLDIPKTLEYLETQGVAVATFADGRSGHVDFPAFYTRDSGVKSPQVLQTEEDAARIILAQHTLGLQSGIHFANPIPEQFSVPFAQMEEATNQALEAATASGATGAASTPYILAKIKEITGSKSVEANTALVEANVIRATKVAGALQRLELESESGVATSSSPSPTMTGPAASSYSSNGVSIGTSKSDANTSRTFSQHDKNVMKGLRKRGSTYQQIAAQFNAEEHIASVIEAVRDSPARLALGSEPAPKESKVTTSAPEKHKANVFVAGSLAVDLACDFSPKTDSSLLSPELKTSNPANIVQSLGGVGHNVARAAHLMGADVRLCSAVGDDLTGKAALEALSSAGMSTEGIKTLPQSSGSRTAQYIAVNDKNKDLVLAMADMSILETPSTTKSTLTTTFNNFWLPQLQFSKPTHLVLDGNWPPQYLALWLSAARSLPSPPHITFEPVSTSKSTSIFSLPPTTHTLSTFPHNSISLATPNTHELNAMYTAGRASGLFSSQPWWSIIDALGIPHSGARAQLTFATSRHLVDEGIPQQTIQLLPYMPVVCCKLGSQGVLLTQILPAGDSRLTSPAHAPYILSRCSNGTEETVGVGGVYMRLFPAVEEVKGEDVVSVNGVGDTFAGTLVAGLAKRKAETNGKEGCVEDFVDVAQRAAVLTLKSQEAVSPGLGTLRLLL
ncbi:Putative pseudouridine-5'-phosphate glycosidase, carbohydrate kinase PfkB, indigoidine synthase A [Septoria linicola]|uniref:Pseudouridine-5'-phosphate glycosidase, carbohydrate kinase PfkB, indigoidine synthase A n=1 Tax=Septoria linicola TaxID=215465 RepID=A0A9Q9ENB0_9PEZI|nr:putative pseudouridine-5'-phosphate glycosidase, carbohydrate kinase PfkB, indigoidine synthase A [Septoria linicola]USW56384.1 Putative pseudouridine-5'-phosphate glycosidase, carbohydrate kinase PfkB, indigoidine synthase A [Septoria linicola]